MELITKHALVHANKQAIKSGGFNIPTRTHRSHFVINPENVFTIEYHRFKSIIPWFQKFASMTFYIILLYLKDGHEARNMNFFTFLMKTHIIIFNYYKRVGWKVRRLTRRKLCHSYEIWYALNSTFPDTNCIVSFQINPHWISNSGFWKVVP